MTQILPKSDEKPLMPEPMGRKRQANSQGSNHDRRLWGSIRWFVAEFAVVVSGVLVALALTAYYQGQQDAAREQAYLRQIATDLHQSEESFTRVIEKNGEEIIRLRRLSDAFTAATPPSDSALSRLVSTTFNSAEQTTGTARALVLTGDIHLLRDDSVRSAIIHFVSVSEAYADRFRRVEWEWIRPSIYTFYSATRPLARGDHPFSVRISDLLDDPEFYNAVADLRLAFLNYVKLQRRMLTEIRKTQTHVDEALRE